jgi:hypothetical protein
MQLVPLHLGRHVQTWAKKTEARLGAMEAAAMQEAAAAAAAA